MRGGELVQAPFDNEIITIVFDLQLCPYETRKVFAPRPYVRHKSASQSCDFSFLTSDRGHLQFDWLSSVLRKSPAKTPSNPLSS